MRVTLFSDVVSDFGPKNQEKTQLALIADIRRIILG